MEIALAISAPRRLAALASVGTLDRAALLGFLRHPLLDRLLPSGAAATHLYFGSEYCEHLFPRDRDLASALAHAERLGLGFSLLTPIASDRLVERVAAALRWLPETSEVIANDWGIAKLVRSSFPRHRIGGGRQLAKMIKDPRLPAPAWSAIHPSGYKAASFARLLSSLGIGRLELDAPPFARAEDFAIDHLAVAAWAPYAYVAKGRICKIGSLNKEAEDKFGPGSTCRRECLGILEREAPSAGTRLRTFRRGTTLLYEHDESLIDVLRNALERGYVQRLVLSEI